MIRWLFKWMFRLAVLLVVLLIVLVLSLDSIVRSIIEERVRAETGMETRIGRLSVGLLSPTLTAENVKVFNSAEFGGSPFLDLPEVHVEYDRFALLRGKLHFILLRINLAEADIVKSDKGHTNVLAMKAVTRAKPSSARRYDFAGIDVLNLSIGKVRFVDIKNPQLTHERVFGFKNRVYPPIKTVGDLHALVFLLWLQSGGGNFKVEGRPNPSSPAGWWSPSDTAPGNSQTSHGTPS